MFKKLILLTVVAASCWPTTQVVAQEEIARERKIRFGAYVAPTLSWMRPTANKSNDGVFASENNGSKMGFTYGVMAEYFFAENYAFVTGLQVNMTGGKLYTHRVGGPTAEPLQVNTADFTYNLQYIELPLALKLRTDLMSGFRFFGQAGITTGVNLGKKANYQVEYTDDAGTQFLAEGEREKVAGTLSIAPVLFAMSLGIGGEYQFDDKMAAYLGVFFNNGFAPDATNPNNYKINHYKGDFKDGNTRLNNFALRLGIFF